MDHQASRTARMVARFRALAAERHPAIVIDRWAAALVDDVACELPVVPLPPHAEAIAPSSTAAPNHIPGLVKALKNAPSVRTA